MSFIKDEEIHSKTVEIGTNLNHAISNIESLRILLSKKENLNQTEKQLQDEVINILECVNNNWYQAKNARWLVITK